MQKRINLFAFFTCITAVNIQAQGFRIDSVSEVHYKITLHRIPTSYYRWGFYHKQDISITHGKFQECKVTYTGDSLININYNDSFGTYWVCLESTDFRGIKDTSCRQIIHNYRTISGFTGAFSPGKDSTGKEKEFLFRNGQFAKYDMTVFTRWGQKIFESTDPSKGWNGRILNTGEDCPQGVYYYILKYTLEGSPDKKETLTGHITLIR